MNQGRRLLDRLTAWSPILLLGSLAALTFWLDAQVAPQPPRRDGSSRHDPDIYAENFRAVSFAPDGKVSQSLSAQRAHHFPDDDSTEFMAPAIVLTEPGRPRFAVNADKAALAGDRETIAFSGNVRAVRDALPSPPKTGAAKRGRGPRRTRDRHHRVFAGPAAAGSCRYDQARDDRGSAWNNPRRRHGTRQ